MLQTFNPFGINTSKYGTNISINMNQSTDDYVITVDLVNKDGTIISTSSIDLPIEALVKSGRYDSETKTIILVLENDEEINIPIGDLISGLQEEITSNNKLDADLVDDTTSTNKFITSQQEAIWNSYTIRKYTNISTGEVSFKFEKTVGSAATQIGDTITFDGDGILIDNPDETQGAAQEISLQDIIDYLYDRSQSTYNFTTFTALNIDTHNKTLRQLTNELIAKNLPQNTIVTGQIYSAALPFSGNGEAEVLVNHPAYWWTCKSLNVAPYSWNALTASSTWGDQGIVIDWTPDNKDEVVVTQTNTAPQDPTTDLWINLGQKQTIQIPETAQDVSYNGQNSLLEANNVQDAIDLLSQSAFPFLTVKIDSGSSIVITDGTTTINGITVLGEFKTKIPNFGTWTITATLNGKTATDTVAISLIKNYQIELSYTKIYGVEWDLTTKGKVLSRTDDSALFTDPVPFVNDNNTPGFSPFDNLYPWKDITIVQRDGNSLVKIPKFWVKIEKTAEKLSFKIADKPTTGFMISPAHRDRGDGEKDFVYIGRYHSDSTYKSVSGQTPIASITRATARVNTHNLGSEYWQLDISMWLTIWFLYLVEFANWDSQACIGYNCGNNSSKQATGSTDLMPYHTGTMQTSRTTYGVGVQYRYIEDPWGNVLDWCDGIAFNQANIYCFENFADYSDDYTSTGATLVGTRPTSSNYIQDFGISSENGFEWFMYPSSVGSSQDNVPDSCYYSSTGVVLFVGGYYYQGAYYGLFCLDGGHSASYQYGGIGVRLQCLPSTQP